MKHLFVSAFVVVLGVAAMPPVGLAAVSLSQSTVTLNIGQSTTIYAYGVTNWLYISNNTNPSVANVSVSGSQVNVTGNAVGSTSITLCDQNGQSGCASLYVTVSSYGGSQSLTFSQSNVYLSNGQNTSVSVYGGSSSYYISSNSNTSVVDTTVNGSTIWLSPRSQNGSATIIVCSSGGSTCGSFTVTVSGSNYYGYGTVSFSQTNPTMSVGQNLAVTLSGGYGNYYLSSSANNVVQASISGSTLNLYAVTPGSATLSVCSSGSGSGNGCSSFYVTVSGYNTYGTGYYGTGYNYGMGYNYGTGYNYQTNANLLAQIQSLEVMLAQLKAQALAYSGSSYYGGQYGQVLGQSSYVFYSNLSLGSRNGEVTALQQYLTNRGVYSGPITGYYWTLTAAAVRQYQSLHGLPVTGAVDAATRNALNAGY